MTGWFLSREGRIIHEKLALIEEVVQKQATEEQAKARFKPPSTDEIRFTAEDGFQFVLHLDQVKQAAMRIFSKCDQYIDIALRAKIVTQNGAK